MRTGLLSSLGALGAMAIVGFVLAFQGIAWDWSMFMDDTAYNSWMPGVQDIGQAWREEIRSYLALGRFYPVKYLANLLKWRYLPNDPYAFRVFNLGVFFLTAALIPLAALRAARGLVPERPWPLLVFLASTAIFHKPLLEMISLNPLGETWVCLFLACGSWCLFQEHWLPRALLSRFFFLLVAFSKEPAAMAFFACGAHSLALACLDSRKRRRWLALAVLDLAVFSFLLGTALWVMAQGSFTKSAYFATTPWLAYAKDLVYKMARYALWTAPFLAAALLARRELLAVIRLHRTRLLPPLAFFLCFAFPYELFMSSQGIVAYQVMPAAAGYFGLCSLALVALASSEDALLRLRRFFPLLLLLFFASYSFSVGRWVRFVRGFVEPRKAVVQLLQAGYPLTILVPRGEIRGHIEHLLKTYNPEARVFDAEDGTRHAELLRGKVFLFEFPVYMGELPAPLRSELERLAGGWAQRSDAGTYRIHVGKKDFGF